MHTVLVIGGYGFFGRRICESLATHPGIRLLIGGRDRAKAVALAHELQFDEAQAVQIDAGGDSLAATLQRLTVNTVVHTAGPFQGQDFRVARSAIQTGCHYIDLADGRGFVTGITALDTEARARGVTVVSGASSVPALSGAVVDQFRGEFADLQTIRIGISSGARSPGIATVRGVFSYAGKPIRYREEGGWRTGYGWRGLERRRFAAPLGARWMSLCEVPDLDLLPARFPTARSVTFKAGFASDAGHLLVWALAGLVKAGLLPSLVPFAGPLNRISRWIEPLISHRGGMFVEMTGIGIEGGPHRRLWQLLAEHNHGPYIPCGAAIVLAKKLADGQALPAGAMPCLGLVTVAEYLEALQGLSVREMAA
ncbi:MAG: saccharopine dehydrogenase NADP-binding domain-containing protein [Steroidobacteraceae bacterium]